MNNSSTPNEEFQDPLENYAPKQYDDPVEQAICQSPISEVQHEPFTTISPDDTVATAVNKLSTDHIACLLVAENEKLRGLFTHREVLNFVALEDDILDRPVSEVMTSDPVCVRDDDPVAAAMCVMAVHGYRHVPILTTDDKIYGIVSPQRIEAFLASHVSNAN